MKQSLNVQYEQRTQGAIRFFWESREKAAASQQKRGIHDTGERAKVTAGQNMDGFTALLKDIVCANGLTDVDIQLNKQAISLPGHFRAAKLWDMLVIHKGKLIAAIELKSQVGPSFGNNFNNRTEEAIGSACDFWKAYERGLLGENAQRPFLGWLLVIEDVEASRTPVKINSPHFPHDPIFNESSYQLRYDILCKRLVQERLYTSATVVATPASAKTNGAYYNVSDCTSIKNFICAFAAHIAAEAAMQNDYKNEPHA